MDGRLVKDWVGEFFPKRIRVIPLIEDIEHLFNCDSILEEYLVGRDCPDNGSSWPGAIPLSTTALSLPNWS